MSSNPTLDAALSLAKLGIAVFPCRGKRPAIPDGFKGASTVREVVKAWFSGEEGYNLAAAIPEWAVVLDVDGEQGERSLKEHGFVPPGTTTIKTPRGWHYWYHWKGESNPIRKIGFLPHVDILSNGYSLVPPSTGYAWHEADSLSKDAIEVAPEWLVTAVSEVASEKDKINVDEWFGGLPEGSRQTGLFRYACRLRNVPRMTRTEAKLLVAGLAKASEGKGYRKYPDTDALVERVWKTYDAAEEREPESESKVWSLADLLSTVSDKPDYLVDRLLPAVGYTILFAAQGVGKSVLADQVALSVATGKPFLNRDVKRSGALVLDIEQEPFGASERWRKLMFGMGIADAPANLHTAFSWPLLEDGGFKKIADFLVEHPHIRLVVVDTLAQATANNGEGYDKDSQSMGRFTRFAREYGIAFLIVTHSRKSSKGSPDSFADMASGTRGITGPAKARWGLRREEMAASGSLTVGGKLPEAEIHLTFDPDYLMWR